MPTTFHGLIKIVLDLISITLPILVGLALLAFFWGLVTFVFKLGGDEKVEDGRKLMIWGVIALFIMLSFVGIIRFFYSDFWGGPFVLPLLPGGLPR